MTRDCLGEESLFQFMMQSKAQLHGNFETLLFKDEGDQLKFGSAAEHEIVGEFEEQMLALEREYPGFGEFLSVHHPDTTGRRSARHGVAAGWGRHGQ